MDDFMLVRFALDNVRVPEIAATAQEALDRIIQGRPSVDPDSDDGRAYERGQRRARSKDRTHANALAPPQPVPSDRLRRLREITPDRQLSG